MSQGKSRHWKEFGSQAESATGRLNLRLNKASTAGSIWIYCSQTLIAFNVQACTMSLAPKEEVDLSFRADAAL
jgi:hypothetical protein